MRKIRTIIIDDEKEMLESYAKLFKRKVNYKLTLSSTFADAKQKLLNFEYDLMLVDLKLDEGNGIELIKEAIIHHPEIKIIMITGYGTIEASVEAMRAGAVDFIEKPFSSKALFSKIENLFAEHASFDENEINNFYGIIYKSKEMEELINTIKKIAPSDITVLIQGESGSGKELIARAIHKLSTRKNEAFVPVNCGALPENLFESELFGHEKGAFTGAQSTKPGILEFANNGTFFFDEITETPFNIQVKLLRMLEEKKIRRIGGSKEIDLDIRIISATNQNLDEAIKNNILRQDLFYRLSSFVINIPPLRERRDDILPLFYHYMNSLCDKYGQKRKKLSQNAEDLLLKYNWPGNVREIINLTNKLYFICNRESINEEDLPLPSAKNNRLLLKEIRDLKYKDAKDKVLESFEIDYLRHNLQKYDGNISKTAENCGMDRRTIHRMIKKYGIIFK